MHYPKLNYNFRWGDQKTKYHESFNVTSECAKCKAKGPGQQHCVHRYDGRIVERVRKLLLMKTYTK
jgi:DUF971 family protein